jgi:hypothetical protein
MRPTERLSMLRDRLGLVMRRCGKFLFAEALVDQNGRHHPALRSGASARASARIGDRWHTLRHLFARLEEQDMRDGDVSGVAFSPEAPRTPPAKTPSAGRNAAA